MLLATDELRVALLTTHVPLQDVSALTTPERLQRVIRALHAELQQCFGISQPHIKVCGLNPHAGEGGHLGREEIEIIIPTLQGLRHHDGQTHQCQPDRTTVVNLTERCLTCQKFRLANYSI